MRVGERIDRTSLELDIARASVRAIPSLPLRKTNGWCDYMSFPHRIISGLFSDQTFTRDNQLFLLSLYVILADLLLYPADPCGATEKAASICSKEHFLLHRKEMRIFSPKDKHLFSKTCACLRQELRNSLRTLARLFIETRKLPLCPVWKPA